MLQSMSVLHPYFWPKKTSLYHNLFLYSSVDKHWGGFNFLAIMDNTAANIHVKGFVWTHVLNFLGYILQRGTAGSLVTSCLIFWEIANSSPQPLHHFTLPQQHMRFLISKHCCQYFFYFLLPSWGMTEKATALYSSVVAWKIPWMEEPGRLQSMGLLRVVHDWRDAAAAAAARVLYKFWITDPF